MKAGTFVKHFGQALIMLAVMLAALFFVLYLGTKAPAPIGGVAGDIAGAANGSAFGL